jgi:hypothetical protein
VFRQVNFVDTADWENVDPWTWRLRNHPLPGIAYIAGVDVGAGIGQDYSVLNIFSLSDGEQVYECRNNMAEPDLFAARCARVLMEFNTAFVNPERNNHGILFIKELLQGYPPGRVYRPQRGRGRSPVNEIARLAEYGTYTSEVVKAMAVGALQQQLREELTIHSRQLRDELGSYVENEHGKLEAEHGCYDDLVMATAMMAFARAHALVLEGSAARAAEENRGRRTREIFEASLAFEELIARHETGGDPLPISDGVEWDEQAVAWPVA